MVTYLLARAHEIQVDIKKSRFVARCLPILSAQAAMDAVAQLRVAEATHNCWAWRLGQVYRFSDDGEPGGSAGRPMLAAIDGQSFDGVLAHVVRYFGGVKLGVGGLVRAYGNTVAQCLREAERTEHVPMQTLRFLVDFSDGHAVYGMITQRKLVIKDEAYTPDGIAFEIVVRADACSEICDALRDMTRARIQWLEPKA
ncbi:MAG: YigZ family protein [Proteobacteria bacterium]|nr:YigZ family protein [Pseudomonadota bacterium]